MVWYAKERQVRSMAVRNMTRCALFAALMAICAWLAVPMGQVTFSMQSFAVLLALYTLGGKRGCIAVAVYLALGAMGLPVFTGFRGGIGVLLGPTGGFLWGFFAGALAYWLLQKKLRAWLNMAAVMAVCYACGAIWYAIAFGGDVWAVTALCVLPYLLPDALKLVLALILGRRLQKYA